MAATAEQMATFEWKGRDRLGNPVNGERRADDPLLLKAALRQQGIVPLRVRKKNRSLFNSRGRRIGSRELACFTRQLSAMLAAGIPLAQSFEIIANASTHKRLQTLARKLCGDVATGHAFCEALARHPRQFDDLYVNLVATGESAGALDQVLERIAAYTERVASIKARVRKALYYPATIIAVAAIVMAILMIYVVPQFEQLFTSYGADLPALTTAILGISRALQTHGWLLLSALFLIALATAGLKRRSRRFSAVVDRVALKIPVLGGVLKKSALARFSRTLATTFTAGVPLADALSTVAGACGNSCYARAVHRMRDDVVTGESLQQAMQQSPLFPAMLVQMTAVGEETGALDTMLNKVADFYEEETEQTVDALSSLLEPAIMLFIGVAVGAMVVAMYLPIFRMAAII